MHNSNIFSNFAAKFEYRRYMNFSEEQKRIAWQHANVVEGYDHNHVRKDVCGAWIVWGKYGCQDSPFGWEIDHVFPQKLGGDERDINLMAIHCVNNQSKNDDYPSFFSAITSQDTHNKTERTMMLVPMWLQQELKKNYPNA